MQSVILKSLAIGSLMGFIFELIFRSINARKIIWPKFINWQMYGISGMLIAVLYYFKIPITLKIVLIFMIPTLIEFTAGYLYLKIKNVYLWDYKNEPLNFMGLVCLKFSIIWFVIAMFGYCIILPFII